MLGGSIAGLLVARVLAEWFRSVTIVDRDQLPSAPTARAGVPQGRHVHALLSRGGEALEQLLPGITDELTSGGAVVGDILANTTWYPRGHRLRNVPCGLRVISASRPFIETAVRRRVASLPNVMLRARTIALGLLADGGRVCGVQVRPPASQQPVTLTADLVVDATGRASRAPEWLEALAFPCPREERLVVRLSYATRTYRVPADVMRGRVAVIQPPTAEHPRGALAQAIEGDRVMVSFNGYRGYEPQADTLGLLHHAKSLAHRDIEEIISHGEPLDGIAEYFVGANMRRHFETLERFPEGFLVVGDAICAFNPSYAQGMTVAALEALALRDCLAQGHERLGLRFFSATTGLVDQVWKVGLANDLQIPTVERRRPLIVRVLNAWVHALLAAAESDEALALAFIRVANLVDPPARLRSFFAVTRVLRSWGTAWWGRLRTPLRCSVPRD